jgi:hypothetical protein
MKVRFTVLALLFLSSCSIFQGRGKGQIVFHWERERTGIEKFARDHSECMRKAESTRIIPDVRGWFYSQEKQLNLRANWHAERGIWASYVATPGAMPVMVNSIRDDTRSNPRKYRLCMENRGYWHRTSNIPTTTNLFVYRPQTVFQDIPMDTGLR